MKKITIKMEDADIPRIGVDNQWVIFISEEGDEIMLEKDTLLRGIACYDCSTEGIAENFKRR